MSRADRMGFVKKLVLSCFLITAVLVASPAQACTSFAVYSDEPIYALNFDYRNTELCFTVHGDEIPVFTFLFQLDNSYRSTAMMNGKGFFISLLEQNPAPQAGKREPSEGSYFITDLIGHTFEANVTGLLNNIEGKRLVHRSGIGAHAMAADSGGNAAILEVGIERNEVLPIEGDFIVITNFKNSDFKDKQYDQVEGAGAYRYITANEYIRDNPESFDVSHAFEALQLTTQDHTLCSMVFAPKENSIYIALNKDFEKLWKISLDDKTIETYKGFDKKIKLHIPREGIIASDLREGNYSKYRSASLYSSLKVGLIISGISLLVVAAIIFLILTRRKRPSSN